MVNRNGKRIERLEMAKAPKPRFRVIIYQEGEPETMRLPDGKVEGPRDFIIFISSDVAKVG